MLLNMMNEFLTELDISLIYVCIAVLIVGFILGIVKKAVKVSILTGILAVAFVFLIPVTKNFQEKYHVSVNDDKALVIVADGNEIVIGGDEADREDKIVAIEITRNNDKSYAIHIDYESGGSRNTSIPGYMKSALIKYLDGRGYRYHLNDQTDY